VNTRALTLFPLTLFLRRPELHEQGNTQGAHGDDSIAGGQARAEGCALGADAHVAAASAGPSSAD